MFDVAHAFCLLDTELLTLLVPAPLINLAKGKASTMADHFKRFFAPMGVNIKLFIQSRQPVYIFALPLTNNALPLLRFIVKVKAAPRYISLLISIIHGSSLVSTSTNSLLLSTHTRRFTARRLDHSDSS